MSAIVMARARPLGTRRRSGALVGTVVALIAGAVAWGTLAGDDDPPVVVALDVPTSYRIEYRTEYGDTQAVSEELSVSRPFDSRLDSPVGRRSSSFGEFVTGGEGGMVRLSVPIVPAGDDIRPLAVLDDAIDAGHLEELRTRSVAGRPCREIRFGAPVSSGFLVPVGTRAGEHADACIDGAGLVLAESWTLDGEVFRTREAVRVDVDTGPVTPFEAETALEFDDGGGAVSAVDADADPGFGEYWRLDGAPEGFAYLGRWAVVPPDFDVDRSPFTLRVSSTAFVSDVYTRGADVVVVDQGAAVRGDPIPFDDRDVTETIEVDALGQGTVVWDLRMSEVRFVRPDGGFVRVSGTLRPGELVELAHTLHNVREGESP